MGSNERRERERLALRKKILDAARELFIEHGYEKVTMRKIAEKIEYSATAIYLHFPDKDALIRELCAGDFRRFAARFHEIALIADPIERLRRAALAYVDFGLRHPGQYRLMFMTPPPTGELPDASQIEKGNPQQDAYAFLTFAVRDVIARGLLKEDLTDVELVSQVLWAGLHGVISLHVARAKEDKWIRWKPAKKSAELMARALIGGLLR